MQGYFSYFTVVFFYSHVGMLRTRQQVEAASTFRVTHATPKQIQTLLSGMIFDAPYSLYFLSWW
jgi:hypothetical protein